MVPVRSYLWGSSIVSLVVASMLLYKHLQAGTISCRQQSCSHSNLLWHHSCMPVSISLLILQLDWQHRIPSCTLPRHMLGKASASVVIQVPYRHRAMHVPYCCSQKTRPVQQYSSVSQIQQPPWVLSSAEHISRNKFHPRLLKPKQLETFV